MNRFLEKMNVEKEEKRERDRETESGKMNAAQVSFQ